MEKMWAGRFSKSLDKLADDFNSSIHFDSRMYKQDITGSIAHATMLAAKGIISELDSELIVETLSDILEDLEGGKLAIDENAEDIHMFVEAELTKRIGDYGKKLHTARSRNDQVALDLRLYLLDQCVVLEESIKTLVEVILNKA
ncbi:MAG: lyase family protein, partial [Acutalibacteraceae bacterium]|nr:lyase family protein [Acutalibacteraceae bacterium]